MVETGHTRKNNVRVLRTDNSSTVVSINVVHLHLGPMEGLLPLRRSLIDNATTCTSKNQNLFILSSSVINLVTTIPTATMMTTGYRIRFHSKHASTQPSRFTVYVNNQPITCLADSSATVNLLSQEDYNRLCPKPPLEKPNTTISAYGNQYSFSATEQFQAELRSEYCSCSLTVCVVPGREKPILSWMTSQKLKLITLVHGVDDHSNDPKPEDMTSQLSDISIN